MSIAMYVAAMLSALWIDYGWQPLAGGGNEYIIQVPPELVDTLSSEGIESYVPPGVENIRRIRITVGRESLPQAIAKEPETPSPATAKKPSTTAPLVNNAQERVANYPDESKSAKATADNESSTTPSTADAISRLVGLDALTLAAIGLGIAAALVVFLVWANLSMRARYRALLLDRRRELTHAR